MTSNPVSSLANVRLPDGTWLPVADAIQAAAQLHQAGRLRKADAIYRQVLLVEPGNVDALHLSGLVARQFGDYATAVDLIGRAIKLSPKVAMFHNNLAQTYLAMGQPNEAIHHCNEALTLEPDLPEAHYNLAMALRSGGRLDEAIARFEQALHRNPDFIGAWVGLAETVHKKGRGEDALAICQTALSRYPNEAALLSSKGVLLRALGRVDDAIAHYKEAIALRPDIPELHNNLAIAYKAKGDLAGAAACYRRVLELRPKDESARHMLNAMQQAASDHAPRRYVQETFDDYADNFDQHLTKKLEYLVPRLVAEAVKGVLKQDDGQKLDVLDLGCGTGLVGVELHDISGRLVGIDLSPKMIAKARERSMYSKLVVGDLLEQLEKLEPDSFDLVTAADVFVYIGNLAPIFEQCSRVLRPGGLFAFSLEALSDEDQDFKLTTTGRYQQSRAYIEKLGRRFGFSEAHFAPICVRVEEGRPVSGYLYLLRKQSD